MAGIGLVRKIEIVRTDEFRARNSPNTLCLQLILVQMKIHFLYLNKKAKIFNQEKPKFTSLDSFYIQFKMYLYYIKLIIREV